MILKFVFVRVVQYGPNKNTAAKPGVAKAKDATAQAKAKTKSKANAKAKQGAAVLLNCLICQPHKQWLCQQPQPRDAFPKIQRTKKTTPKTTNQNKLPIPQFHIQPLTHQPKETSRNHKTDNVKPRILPRFHRKGTTSTTNYLHPSTTPSHIRTTKHSHNKHNQPTITQKTC